MVGRPRGFDTERALDCAMRVFWRKGYEGASLPELTRAMGINRPSLYSAFGNKEMLFRRALDRYAEGPSGYMREALDETTAYAVVERLLRGLVDLLTNPKNPPGCLMVQGALACGKKGATARRELTARRAGYEVALRRRLARAVREGDLPRGCEPAVLAKYVAVVVHGLAVQAAGGAGRRELQQVARTALRAWPMVRASKK